MQPGSYGAQPADRTPNTIWRRSCARTKNTQSLPHKEAATEFLRLASRGDVTRAYDTYVSESFRHHNPYFRGDAGSLAKAMKDNAVQNPNKQFTVERVIEEGDLVVVHGRVRHNDSTPEAAVVHIFRFDGDRVVELWDVGQEIPADSPNQYGMF